MIKTFQCQTCGEDVKIDFRRFEESWNWDLLASSCTCKVLWVDYFQLVENKVDGGFQISGRLFGSQSEDLEYGHTVSRSPV